MNVAIVGGGLAGCALAFALNKAGAQPVVYEAGPSLACGASGNPAGLYNPRFTAERTPESDYYTAAFSLALQTFKSLQRIDWNPCGALHLINDEKKSRRYDLTVQSWGWDSEQMRIVGMDEASEIAGVDIQFDALYLKQSGSVSPEKLCEAFMKDVDFHLNAPVESLDELDADIIILACGPAVKTFLPELPIGTVRGQITSVKSSQASEDLKCAICYGGYFSPALDGIHIVGSTFQRWLDHDEVIDQDDYDNLQKLANNVPGMEQGLEIVGRRASMRATSRDHFPIVGAAPGMEHVYISAAHGSHGILSALMAAYLLTDIIMNRPLCLPADTVDALSAQRFV